MSLVVEIYVYKAGTNTPRRGTGFVLGQADGRVYVATAGHVIKHAFGPTETDTGRVQIAFEADTATAVGDLPIATIERWVDDDSLDLAVISVAGDGSFELDRVGTAGEGDRVFPVGCGREGPGCWQVPRLPEVISIRTRELVSYQTLVTSGGHSGGPLFNSWGEIVGMILMEGRASQGHAQRIGPVLDRIKRWGYGEKIGLRKSAVPRAGPLWTVEMTHLWAIGADPVLSSRGRVLRADSDWRFFSGRLSLSRRIFTSPRAFVSAHVTGLRLAPTNLAIGAGLGGFQGLVRWGRLAVGAFVEIGFGHIESQFDVGGHFLVSEGGENVYLPFYDRIEADGIGGGFGGRLDVNVLRWLVLEGTVVKYAFNLPDSAQRLPDLWLGAGVRIGG